MKICSKCKQKKELNDFRIRKDRKCVRSNCKQCEKIEYNDFIKTKQGVILRIYTSQKSSSKKRNMQKPTYSKEWLQNWLLSNPEFHRLYDIWKISGYIKALKPSIDRIDDNIGYTEYNIQLMDWNNNLIKGLQTRKKDK